MSNKDGIAKNIDVIKGEFRRWKAEMSESISRLKKSSFRLDKTNVIHVLVSFIEETFDSLPRTLTYITIIGGIIWVALLIAKVF